MLLISLNGESNKPSEEGQKYYLEQKAIKKFVELEEWARVIEVLPDEEQKELELLYKRQTLRELEKSAINNYVANANIEDIYRIYLTKEEYQLLRKLRDELNE